MIIVTNPEAIAAQNGHPAGIVCKENEDGQLVLTAWPGQLPTQSEVEAWEAAYANSELVEAVVTERKRRLAAGFDYDFGDARGVHRIGTTDADMAGWDEVTAVATARALLNDTTPITIATDTGACQVTPLEWMAILEAAAAFRQPIWLRSFQLQASPPADPSDDANWN